MPTFAECTYTSKMLYGSYRYYGYTHNGVQLQALTIELPLATTPFKELIAAEKVGLANNFVSAFISHAGSIVLFHSEELKEIQDDCPIILCYSNYSGTGIVILHYVYFTPCCC